MPVDAATRYTIPRSPLVSISRRNSSGVNARRLRFGSSDIATFPTDRIAFVPTRLSSQPHKPKIAARYSFNVFAESPACRARHASKECGVTSRRVDHSHSRISRKSFRSRSRTYFSSRFNPRLLSANSSTWLSTDCFAASRCSFGGIKPSRSRSASRSIRDSFSLRLVCRSHPAELSSASNRQPVGIGRCMSDQPGPCH